MTKRKTIKLIAEVVDGRNCHTVISVMPQKRGYSVVLGNSRNDVRQNWDTVDISENELIFQHDRNTCTLREAQYMLEHDGELIGFCHSSRSWAAI